MPFDERAYERAEWLSAREREAGIARLRRAETDAPREVDGRRYCLDCDAPIPAARLKAVPHAARCADCQAEHEHRQRPGAR